MTCSGCRDHTRISDLTKAFAALLVLLSGACTVERHDLAQNRVPGDTLPPSDATLDLRLGTVCQAYDRAAALARVDTLPGRERVEHLRAASMCETVGSAPVDVPATPR